MNKGFTLVELLVVVLIIGILSVVALPQYTDAVERSRAAEVMVNAKAIMDGMQRYKQMYPGENVTQYRQLADVQITGISHHHNVSSFSTKNFTYTLRRVDGLDSVVATRIATGSFMSDTPLYHVTYSYTDQGPRIRCAGDGQYADSARAPGIARICKTFTNLSVD